MTKRIRIDHISADPEQPRKLFDTTELQALAASILENGLIQPITVRAGKKRGHYVVIAGERRWRAHGLLVKAGHRKFASIDANVVATSGAADTRIKQIVENVQRQDMTLLEEADALVELQNVHGLSEEEIAKRLGLAVFRVRWRLLLQNLAPQIRKMVAADQLDRQQAMEIARLPKHADQTRIVQLINRRELVGWKATRNAVDAILTRATQADIFGDTALMPPAKERAVVRSMEQRIEQIAAMVAGGWRNGECVIASKIAPDRAAKMADQLAGLKSALSHMERELRNVSAQAKIVLAG